VIFAGAVFKGSLSKQYREGQYYYKEVLEQWDYGAEEELTAVSLFPDQTWEDVSSIHVMNKDFEDKLAFLLKLE